MDNDPVSIFFDKIVAKNGGITTFAVPLAKLLPTLSKTGRSLVS